MGDEQRQGGVTNLVLFLDENHCRNPHVIEAIEEHDIVCEKHLDHFQAGSEDTEWLPVIGQRGWCLLTTDARIRKIHLRKRPFVQTAYECSISLVTNYRAKKWVLL